MGDVFRSANTGQRAIGCFLHKRLSIFAELRALAMQHGCIDIAGADAVHTNLVAAMVDGHGACQIHGASLRGTIRGSARAAFQRPSRADVDDAAASGANHVGHDFAREQKNSFKRHVEGTVPFFLGEFDYVLAYGNAGAVAQDIDLATFLNDGLDGAAAVRGAADVTLQGHSASLLIVNLLRGLARFRVINVEYGNGSSELSKSRRDATTNA